MSRLLGTRARAVVLVATLVVVAACTDDGGDQPAPTKRPTTPSSVVDRSGIALAGVPGETTTTIVERGTAVIAGGVQGPGGLIPGATVRIERLVAGREVRTDVVTGPDGRYVLSGVPGGRYRLRAFMPPSLVQLEPDIRFLADGEEHVVDLQVEQQGGLVVRADVAPDTPIVDDAVNLVAMIGIRTVSADGVVTTSPVAGATVDLDGLGRWVLRSARPSSSSSSTTITTRPPPGSSTTTTAAPGRSTTATARTNGSGLARFELVCTESGAPGLSLRVPVASPAPAAPPDPAAPATSPRAPVETVALDLPDCVAAPTTTTAATTTPSSSSTTTSR